MNEIEMKIVAQASDHVYAIQHLAERLEQLSNDKDILDRIADIKSAVFVLSDSISELVDATTSLKPSNTHKNTPRSLENDSDGKLYQGDEN